MSSNPTDDLAIDTLAVRAGIERSQFNEHSEALYLTSSFVFGSAAEAAARFSGEVEGNVYARFTNPTVTAMQQRLAPLEGAEACRAHVLAMLEAGALIAIDGQRLPTPIDSICVHGDGPDAVAAADAIRAGLAAAGVAVRAF